jgi:NTE family protein
MADVLDKGLALSGGGFRATLFHVGSLWRLNELGLLRQLDVVTSVSGGSILNGVLAVRWPALRWSALPDGRERATNFADEIVRPIRSFCERTIDVSTVLIGGLSPFSSIADKVAEAYDEDLYQGATLQDIPQHEAGRTPRFLFYASNLQTGVSVRFSRERLADYRIGEVPAPRIPLARVVGASSAFPPVLSPVYFDLDPEAWRALPGADLYPSVGYRRRMVLTDGGVYDNLGVEAIWDRCRTVFVSDASAPFDAVEDPHTDLGGQLGRVRDIMMEQTRALRRRMIVGEQKSGRRAGAFWGIGTRIDDYELTDAVVRDNAKTAALQHIRTRLNRFSESEQAELINWGYALADAAVRRYAAPSGALEPARLPLPGFPL